MEILSNVGDDLNLEKGLTIFPQKFSNTQTSSKEPRTIIRKQNKRETQIIKRLNVKTKSQQI